MSGMVSQSDIVRYIAKHIHEPHLQAYANSTVAHAGWGNRPVSSHACFAATTANRIAVNQVTSVREGESVKNVIMLMHERGVSAVAIVSRTGTLVGNFSLSDMRGIHEHNFERKLNTCVVDYLQGITRVDVPMTPLLMQRRTAESPDSLRAACTTLKSTVGDVIRALATERLHRLW